MSHPACFNRPDYEGHIVGQIGWTEDGRKVTAFFPDEMSKTCQQWGALGEARLKNWDCKGCRHYPLAPKPEGALK